jgi:hypothetical protein
MVEKGKLGLISQPEGRGSKPEDYENLYEAGAATTTQLRSIEVLMLVIIQYDTNRHVLYSICIFAFQFCVYSNDRNAHLKGCQFS